MQPGHLPRASLLPIAIKADLKKKKRARSRWSLLTIEKQLPSKLRKDLERAKQQKCP
jgi:hypothetical protein